MLTFQQQLKLTQQTKSAKSAIPGRAHIGQSRAVKSILQLQRTVWNKAAQRQIEGNTGDVKGDSTLAEIAHLGHDFSRIPIHTPVVGAIQTKLAIDKPGDKYELEANHITDQVMRTRAPQLQSASVCDAICRKCQTKRLLMKRIESGDSDQTAAPPIVHDALRSSGQPLDAATRAFMEPRFGHDFSHVRVHTDEKAAASSRLIQALAYTAGRNIVFNAGQYSPKTVGGRRLLAHELAHVVQQARGREAPRISRFADTDHNIIEEVALTLAKLSPDEIKQIHAGNTQRDYSQAGAKANLLLLCDPSNYGGYKDYEHFDNFKWDEQLQKWQSRENPTAFGKKNPISHIEEELVKFVYELPDQTAFRHVGSAFHTIEDFFAHSNFVELINGDYRFGKKLITGGPGSGDTAILRILESISSQETAPFYGQQAEKETAKSPQTSHARMAKDYKSNPYYNQAVVLAALVIKEIGAEIKALKGFKTREERIKYIHDVIMSKVKRFLRPPDMKDKWWEELRASGGKEMEKAIKEVTAKTPVTINQCFLSPMRSIEATRDSNFKLIGPAFPIPTKQGHVWVQVGTGFSTGPAFSGPTEAVLPRSLDYLPFGVQVTGRFDFLGGK